MKPIKVLHVVNHITGKADGVYTHLKMIFENTDKSKYQHILIFQGGEKVRSELIKLGVQVFVSESLKKKISIKAFLDIYTIAKKNNVDILHTHLLKPYVIAGLVNIVLCKKFIFNYNGLFIWKNLYYGLTEKIIYWICHIIIAVFGSVDLVLVPSIKSKELLMEETKLFPEPLVYYNGYSRHFKSEPNLKIFKKLQSIKSHGNIIAMVARLEVQKRIDRALILFKRVQEKQKNIFLVIFGDGDQKQILLEKTKNLDINLKVIFFDYVENVVSYYPQFDIILFTSDWEGMPLTMWEAMANGVPVLAPDVGGFKEILEENNCGLIYEASNIINAELKLIQLLHDLQLRKSLGANGRIAVETKYTEEKFIQQIEKIYTNLFSQ